MAYSETEINDLTGFENGDHFESDDDVRAYFTASNMRQMVGDMVLDDNRLTDQDALDEMARTVIEHEWHYGWNPREDDEPAAGDYWGAASELPQSEG